VALNSYFNKISLWLKSCILRFYAAERPLLFLYSRSLIEWVSEHKSEKMLNNDLHPPPHVATALGGPGPPYCRGFTITLRHTTLGRIPLDGLLAVFLTTQRCQETDIHVPGGIRTRNPSKQVDADPRLRPRGHWDRPCLTLTKMYKSACDLYQIAMGLYRPLRYC
jgi:hypothetical protein